ncbi:hypothetical protein B0O80DRAFT_455780 [Mortierella sp. GBAus27b]|nr:hypothetical protein B0O80DRAFT_455780 [Mortierella sp. GBAus27b]
MYAIARPLLRRTSNRPSPEPQSALSAEPGPLPRAAIDSVSQPPSPLCQELTQLHQHYLDMSLQLCPTEQSDPSYPQLNQIPQISHDTLCI